MPIKAKSLKTDQKALREEYVKLIVKATLTGTPSVVMNEVSFIFAEKAVLFADALIKALEKKK